MMGKMLKFNKAGLKKIIGDINAEYLFRAGSALRSRAKSSLKPGKISNGKRQHSKPGEVPYIWGSSPLKNLLFFALDPYNNSMVVGPELFNTKNKRPVPGVLEYGGNVDIKVAEYVPKNKRKWGSKHYEGSRPKLKSGKGDYSYFRSTSAWENASNSTAFQAWGRSNNPKYTVMKVTIEPRPFMQKALNQITSARYSAYLYQKAVDACKR